MLHVLEEQGNLADYSTPIAIQGRENKPLHVNPYNVKSRTAGTPASTPTCYDSGSDPEQSGRVRQAMHRDFQTGNHHIDALIKKLKLPNPMFLAQQKIVDPIKILEPALATQDAAAYQKIMVSIANDTTRLYQDLQKKNQASLVRLKHPLEDREPYLPRSVRLKARLVPHFKELENNDMFLGLQCLFDQKVD